MKTQRRKPRTPDEDDRDSDVERDERSARSQDDDIERGAGPMQKQPASEARKDTNQPGTRDSARAGAASEPRTRSRTSSRHPRRAAARKPAVESARAGTRRRRSRRTTAR